MTYHNKIHLHLCERGISCNLLSHKNTNKNVTNKQQDVFAIFTDTNEEEHIVSVIKFIGANKSKIKCDENNKKTLTTRKKLDIFYDKRNLQLCFCLVFASGLYNA
jgi:hypothetical protein